MSIFLSAGWWTICPSPTSWQSTPSASHSPWYFWGKKISIERSGRGENGNRNSWGLFNFFTMLKFRNILNSNNNNNNNTFVKSPSLPFLRTNLTTEKSVSFCLILIMTRMKGWVSWLWRRLGWMMSWSPILLSPPGLTSHNCQSGSGVFLRILTMCREI